MFPDLKKRQEQIEVEIVNAQALLTEAHSTGDSAHQWLDAVLDLLGSAIEHYRTADETTKSARTTRTNNSCIGRHPGGVAFNERTPAAITFGEGSNVDQLAETEGFEPSAEN